MKTVLISILIKIIILILLIAILYKIIIKHFYLPKNIIEKYVVTAEQTGGEQAEQTGGGQAEQTGGGQLGTPGGEQAEQTGGGQLGTPGGGQLGTPGGGQLGTPEGGQLGTPEGGQLGTPGGGQLGTPGGGQAEQTGGGQLGTPEGGQLGTPEGGQLGTSEGGQLGTSEGGQVQTPADINTLIFAAITAVIAAEDDIKLLTSSSTSVKINDGLKKLKLAYDNFNTAYQNFSTTNSIIKKTVSDYVTEYVQKTPETDVVKTIETQATVKEEIAKIAKEKLDIAMEKKGVAEKILKDVNELPDVNPLKSKLIENANEQVNKAAEEEKTAKKELDDASEVATAFRSISDASIEKCKTDQTNIFIANTNKVNSHLVSLNLPQELILATSSLIYSFK
jgi:hypothetical protein